VVRVRGGRCGCCPLACRARGGTGEGGCRCCPWASCRTNTLECRQVAPVRCMPVTSHQVLPIGLDASLPCRPIQRRGIRHSLYSPNFMPWAPAGGGVYRQLAELLDLVITCKGGESTVLLCRGLWTITSKGCESTVLSSWYW